MTISLVWQRKFAGIDEILFASDSRLSAGYRWDCAQKIFPIDGPNFCISFAGSTDFAFPCIFHFQRMVRNYPRFSDGAAPISVFSKDFVAIVNQLRTLVDDKLLAQFHMTEFLLAGYDFVTGEFYGRSIRYDTKSDGYKAFTLGGIRSGGVEATVGFAGDKKAEYFKGLGIILDKQRTELNYQPLEALSEILGNQDQSSPIGGSPQVVKVYRHRNYLPYAVKKNSSDPISLFGRPLLGYEQTLYPVMALDKFGSEDFIYYPIGANNRKLTPPKGTQI